MSPLVVEGVYEKGMLKLDHPLPLSEHQRVRITVHTGTSLAEQTAGLMGWCGPAELAEYFAMAPDLDFPSVAEEP
jgi:predicted DNA-binding antitoxin AbrB/MazE fold protein